MREITIGEAYEYANEILQDPIQLHVHEFTRETILALMKEIYRLETNCI
jgi:hypothetical protein